MRRIVGCGIIIVMVSLLGAATWWPGWGDELGVRPADVPIGDREMAWIHTSTNGTTWERFVTGLVRTQLAMPGLSVDDRHAFTETTTQTPEVILSQAGCPGRLRVRWYKLTSGATSEQWVTALAARDPAPIALIGGGSTDRAVDLALALNQQSSWQGQRPLYFITTATADEFVPSNQTDAPIDLTKIYNNRTFRFCFTNRNMAEAVTDFCWQTPGLHPTSGPTLPKVLSVVYLDDPFSTDLHARFRDALNQRAQLETFSVPFSVGGLLTPNTHELTAARAVSVAASARESGPVMLVLPTVTNPARRLLKSVLTANPSLRSRLIAVTGDGLPVNAVMRDADFAWPTADLPVPLVLFCHTDPVDWDTPARPGPPGYALTPPNATEEVRHFADLGRIVADVTFANQQLVPDADMLATRLREHAPPLFGPDGERLGRTGEYVCVLRPRPNGATLEVFRRDRAGAWGAVRSVVTGSTQAQTGEGK